MASTKKTTTKASAKTKATPKVDDKLNEQVAPLEVDTPKRVEEVPTVEVVEEPVVEAVKEQEEKKEELSPVAVEEPVKPKKEKASSHRDIFVTYGVDPEVSGVMEPSQGYEGDIGYDLHTPKEFTIEPGSSVCVNTGVRIEVPELPSFMQEHFRTATLFWSKSGLSVKANVETGAGLIDPGYRGNLVVKLYNHSNRAVSFKAGDRVTQLFFVPALKVAGFKLGVVSEDTERGAKGFGSKG